MGNSWFAFKEYHASTIVEFVRVVLEELRSPYMFRGHADIIWELEPVIDRQDFSNTRKSITRADHEQLVFEEFKRLAVPHLPQLPSDKEKGDGGSKTT